MPLEKFHHSLSIHRLELSLLIALVLAGGFTFPAPAQAHVTQSQSREQATNAFIHALVQSASRAYDEGFASCVQNNVNTVAQNEWIFLQSIGADKVVGWTGVGAAGTLLGEYIGYLRSLRTAQIIMPPYTLPELREVAKEIFASIPDLITKIQSGALNSSDAIGEVEDIVWNSWKLGADVERRTVTTTISNAIRYIKPLLLQVAKATGAITWTVIALIYTISAIGCMAHIPVSAVPCDASSSSDSSPCNTQVAMINLDSIRNICNGIEDTCRALNQSIAEDPTSQQVSVVPDISCIDADTGDNVCSNQNVTTPDSIS